MRIRLLTITHKIPIWVQEGFYEYHKRFPPTFTIELVEVPAEKRAKHTDITRIIQREGEKMLLAIHPHHDVIALDVKGKLWSTEQLTEQLVHRNQQGRNLDLLIGGPDGLSPMCLQRAQQTWSLSPLTFPHALVRIIVVEQLYRAWSILTNHPYHRG
ncbi:MAG: 23S rRNA (pseudouridine(1915)-N(3))-methyltransferase RlmH [Gammaproteobacteria bacterium RIFCSPHIGHO2_12_FULL_41_20]|nr:MAG: 23S rRNA (pseudouridine(1915)-N(3))-methyltransferase RlmH [Gammaproteobacteria bacterium RIFCSPHIGHO2_12_FULL_41_20]